MSLVKPMGAASPSEGVKPVPAGKKRQKAPAGFSGVKADGARRKSGPELERSSRAAGNRERDRESITGALPGGKSEAVVVA
jgi:hypothetical protein